jgi:RimJ/RimL family protein N-acetyltransferase
VELVPWGNEHFDDLVRLAADPRVVKYVNDGEPWSVDYATDRHLKALAHWAEHGYGWYAATEDGKFVGLGSMVHRPEEGIEIGWWIDPAHWGRGLATEMAAKLRDNALARSDRVVAGYVDGNDASERVMIKIGLTYVRSFTSGGRLQHVYALQRA